MGVFVENGHPIDWNSSDLPVFHDLHIIAYHGELNPHNWISFYRSQKSIWCLNIASNNGGFLGKRTFSLCSYCFSSEAENWSNNATSSVFGAREMKFNMESTIYPPHIQQLVSNFSIIPEPEQTKGHHHIADFTKWVEMGMEKGKKKTKIDSRNCGIIARRNCVNRTRRPKKKGASLSLFTLQSRTMPNRLKLGWWK